MGALDGIKVLEAGLLVQGPQAAATLAQWGADVVKVELPGFGDQSRWLAVSPEDSRSAYFLACNRNKRSLTIDLRKEGGREVLLQLAETADVVVTNFKPGTMEAWGLGYEDFAARNPGLIYAAGSTFGPEGADAGREGADLSGQAAGGLISATGMDDGDPTPIAATITDHIASQNLVAGILAALVARARTGKGQRVDASLLGGQIWAQASEYTAYLMTGRIPGRPNRSHPMVPGLYGMFPTSDGWIVIVGVVGSDRRTFYALLGRPDLAERFDQSYLWESDKVALFPVLDGIFRTRSTAAWCQALREAGIRHAAVRDYSEVVADPGVWDNGYLTRSADDEEETVVGSPVRFGGTPALKSGRAPELGEHTEEVLLESGWTWDDIALLASKQII